MSTSRIATWEFICRSIWFQNCWFQILLINTFLSFQLSRKQEVLDRGSFYEHYRCICSLRPIPHFLKNVDIVAEIKTPLLVLCSTCIHDRHTLTLQDMENEKYCHYSLGFRFFNAGPMRWIICLTCLIECVRDQQMSWFFGSPVWHQLVQYFVMIFALLRNIGAVSCLCILAKLTFRHTSPFIGQARLIYSYTHIVW